MKVSLVGVACVLALGCSSSTGPIGGQLRVSPAPPALQLTNDVRLLMPQSAGANTRGRGSAQASRSSSYMRRGCRK